LSGQELFVRDVYAGPDPAFRLPIRFMTPNAWHALFVYNMFLRPADGELSSFEPEFEVLQRAGIPPRTGHPWNQVGHVHHRELCAAHLILIGGTRYAGELRNRSSAC